MKSITYYLKVIWKKFSQKTFLKLLQQSSWILKKYRIEGCRTYNYADLVAFKNPFTYFGSMQKVYNELISSIVKHLKEKTPLSIIRLGDGEAYFLQGKFIGNVIKRHFTSGDVSSLDLNEWRDSYLKNDIRSFDANWFLRKLWVPLEGRSIKYSYYPLHSIYSLVATRKIFRISQGYRMGIIGAEQKISLIKKLMCYKEYQGYLGIDEFHSYTSVPEKGACNDVEKTLSEIINKEKSSPCDIYLLGIGISKLYLQTRIRDALNCVIIDVGSGIDAIAGIIPKDRQNFGLWTNYILPEKSCYTSIDNLSYHSKIKDEYFTPSDVHLNKK